MMLAAIGWYQRAFAWKPSPCRFYPSCSSYALEAIEVHGARTGGWLAVRRLARCRPFGDSGIDLVPEPRPPQAGQAPVGETTVDPSGSHRSVSLPSSGSDWTPLSSSPSASSSFSSSKETQ